MFMKKTIIYFIAACSILHINAQSDLDNVVSDLSLLMQQFVKPGIEGTMYQTSSGWYTNGKALNPWDIKLAVQGNLLFVPNGKKTFFVDNNSLSNLSVRPGDSPFFSTAAGGVSNSYLVGNINGQPIEIYAPSGIDESSVFHSQLHLELGLPFGTSFLARLTPKVKIKSSNIQAFGFGLKHNISQWFAKIKESSFDIASIISYSIYKADDEFSPLILIPGESINSIQSEGDTFLFGIIGSKEIGAFDISLAILHSNSKPDLSFGGQGTLVTSVLNQTVSRSTPRVSNTTADIGLNYHYKNFSFNSILTLGDFTNLLVGINYQFKLNRKKNNTVSLANY